MKNKEKLLRDYGRMCLEANCNDCRIGKEGGYYVGCQRWVSEHPKEAVEAIEKWGAEHPVKTRQGEFLKLHPNAKIKDDGILAIHPCDIDFSIYDCNSKINCGLCRHDYWSQEVENE